MISLLTYVKFFFTQLTNISLTMSHALRNIFLSHHDCCLNNGKLDKPDFVVDLGVKFVHLIQNFRFNILYILLILFRQDLLGIVDIFYLYSNSTHYSKGLKAHL